MSSDEEMMRMQQDDAVAQQGLAQQGPSEGDRARLLDMLTDTDLEPPSRRFLVNLAVKDLPLANLDDADLHEFKWKLPIIFEQFVAAHPHEDSGITGGARAYLYDDPSEALEPLSRSEMQQAQTFLDQTYFLATRAKGMEQQKLASKQINESLVQRQGFESDSGGGILGRIRS